MTQKAKPGIGVSVEDSTEKKREWTPAIPKREAPVVDPTPTYTDEQMLGIMQNMQMQLASEAFQHLDFRNATAVQAYAGVLDQMNRSAQTNIRNRQDQGMNSDMAAAADRIAQMFTSLSRKAGMPLILDEPDPTIQTPELSDVDSELTEEVPGNMTIGTEVLSKDDFLTQSNLD